MKNKKVNQAAKLSMRKRLFGSLNLKVLQKWFTQKVQLLLKKEIIKPFSKYFYKINTKKGKAVTKKK